MEFLQNLDLTAVLLALGVVSSFLASLLKRTQWSHELKHFVALGTSLIAGAVLVLANGELANVTDVGQAATVVYAASQAFYHLILRDTAVESKLANTNS